MDTITGVPQVPTSGLSNLWRWKDVANDDSRVKIGRGKNGSDAE